jgi:hypothetical protein
LSSMRFFLPESPYDRIKRLTTPNRVSASFSGVQP